MKYYSLVVLMALITTSSFSQNTTNSKQQTEWRGFQRTDFKFEGLNSHIVFPKKALAGKPWVWRARFPEYHSAIDSSLLAEGFHVAYINTNNKYGSPKAIEIWNHFYTHLITIYGLQNKVVIRCHSRGGLFAYNWAKVNPNKVTCIHADAPVCDFNSWPAGFGTSKGSPHDWAQLKNEYSFTSDRKAKLYSNNPIDGLEQLAKAGVPILHSISLADKVVPPEENSLKLVNRYIRLGGTATVLTCSKGIQKAEGHHYTIDNPQLVIDFIKYHSILNNNLSSSDFHTQRGNLLNAQIEFERNKKGRVAFLGGSITYNPGWRDSICSYLRRRFPDTEFDFVAAGIPSMGTTPGAFRLTRDVLSEGKINLLFEEAAVNDATNERTNKEQIRAMEGIVRHLRKENPAIDLVMMHFVDLDKMADYRSGKVPEVIRNHNQIATHYAIPTINLAKEVTERIDNNEFTWKDDFKNLHPSPFGQAIYAHSMLEFLDNAFIGHLDNDDKITAHKLPNVLDKFCYEKGYLVDIKQAKVDKNWQFVPDWKPTDGTRVRPNYHNAPMLCSNTVGSKLRLKFSGTAVGIAVAAGYDAGIMEYRIDKGVWQKINLFTRWSMNVHLPWYYTLAAELDNKKHTLELKTNKERDEGSAGNACRIRYFYVNGSHD